MRDDGTLDDQYGLDGAIDRSDDIPSTVRSTDSVETSTPRRSLRTRLSGIANPFAARPGRTKLAVATGAVCCLGLVGFSQVGVGGVGDSTSPAPSQQEVAQRAALDAASRGMARQAPAPASPTVSPTPTATPAATKKPKPKAKPRPKRIVPVAGLDQDQMDNAKKIVQAGREMGVPRRGLVIAVATAMQESNLYNYASGVLPESQNYPHQAIGWDHDSVGLFQQRPSSGWGTVGELMDPEYATKAFLSALEEIPGWQDMALTDAAQAVQVSAFPWAYAQHEWRATEVVSAILA
ncbi:MULTISPECIES: peptidase M23 [Micromonospora]|uniref:Peptidase M23 n=1 Tax=Micromonospora solifontis TaxID=2487138 RepID=A0ABX9WJ97_9ACTN|nr:MULTISPECIES: peptidase M23 [Micromonospora]NES15430.1 peptidase M23 [Micromonospora sp. PPF5-17B]NES35824.1 peptidase M23 [Micromonospora solifontis]NES58024.1 peptidase M23 [Micromonospora sp. PPF5-6]RNM00301.1 peptidase M23 [Micromonospora solifontis]